MNQMRTFILLAGLTALLVVLGQALGGKNGMIIALVMAAAMNVWSYWFSDQMVLSMYQAVEVGYDQAPVLHGTVQQLSERAGIPMPRIYIIEDDSPNAFATGRNPEHAAVAATTGLLRLLTREELTGVMAHELAHVINRDILVGTIAATLAGALTSVVQWFAFAGGGRGEGESDRQNPLVAVGMMILAPVAAMLIQMAISRTREYSADADGARLCGNPLGLARALDKLARGVDHCPMAEAEQRPATSHLFIVNPLSGGTIASLFSTHPPMAKRIQLLQQMAYPS